MRTTSLKLALGIGFFSAGSALTGCSSSSDGAGTPPGTDAGIDVVSPPGNDAGSPGNDATPAPDAGTDTGVPGVDAAPEASAPAPKGVYTLSNEASGNKIVAYARAADGSLTASGSYATGGKGTGAGLGDQGSLVFDGTENLFFAVNAGDDTISMLALEKDGSLTLLSNVSSGGVLPISVTVSGSVVYVVNAGVSGDAGVTAANISGFQVANGKLVAIPGSALPLSASNPGPAQIQFAPGGKVLVVTEKGTNKIDTYTVGASGVATGPSVQPSSGTTPFGFDFKDQTLIVSEAFGAAANLSATSSYTLGAGGSLTKVSASVADKQSAACWVNVAGSFAYVANAHSANVTGYKVAADGSLTILNADGVTGQTGMAPVDEDATDANDFLYVLNSGDHSISIFAINADGSLTKAPVFAGAPMTAVGLVAR